MPVKKNYAHRYGIGSLYVKKGYWYIAFSAKQAAKIGLKSRNIATYQAATPTGRVAAERMRRKLSDDYFREIGLLPPQEEAPLQPVVAPTPDSTPPPPAVILPPQEELTLDEHFARFRQEQTGKSKHNTIRSYELAFRTIFGTIAKSESWRNEWESTLKKYTLLRDINANTQNIYLRGVSVFIHWLEDEKILLNGAVEFKRIKKNAQKKVPKEIKIYSKIEIQKLLAVCAKYKNDRHNKLAYMIRLMTAAAVRIHEVFEMKCEDWQFEKGQLRIMHKHGGRYEYVPITEEMSKIYQEMTLLYPSKDDEPMFGYGTDADSNFRKLFKVVATEAGIKLSGRLFHEFKKTYITNLIVTKGKQLSTFEIAHLSRCSVSVIEKHYLLLGNEKLREILESSNGVVSG